MTATVECSKCGDPDVSPDHLLCRECHLEELMEPCPCGALLAGENHAPACASAKPCVACGEKLRLWTVEGDLRVRLCAGCWAKLGKPATVQPPPGERTDTPSCPHCGACDRDAWELDFGGVEGATETSCGSCGRDYVVARHAIVTYSTLPLAPSASSAPGHRRG